MKKASFISKIGVSQTAEVLYLLSNRFILVKDIIIRGGENVVRIC